MASEKLGAYPPRLLTDVPQCNLAMHLAQDVPDERAVPMEVAKLTGTKVVKVAMLHNMLSI